MYVTTRSGTTRGKPMASNCSHDWMPLVSVRRIWSARTPISSPATALPATRCASISLRVRLWRISGLPNCCSEDRLHGYGRGWPALEGARRRALSTLTDFNKRATAGADILGARPDQTVVVVLLDDVRAPAGNAARGDDGREEVDRDAERVEERRRVEVDVGNETLGPADPLVQLHGHLVPFELPRLAARLLRHAPEDRRPRIAGFVDAVPHAHEAPLLGQGFLGEGIDVGDLADLP